MPTRRRRSDPIRPEERSLLARWNYYTGGGGTLADLRGHGRESVSDIVERLRAASRETPTVRMCWRWAYAAEWFNETTGERVFSVRVESETDRDDQRQSAYAKARRLAVKLPSSTSKPRESESRGLVMRLRRIGRPIHVPCT